MSEKIYAWLLRLYPSHFREKYGDEALRLLRDRARDERGFFRTLRLWLDLLVDLTISVPREYRYVRPALAGSVVQQRLRRRAFFFCAGRWFVTSPSVLCRRNRVAGRAGDGFWSAHPGWRAKDRACCYPPRGRSRQVAIRFSGNRDAEKGGGCKGSIERSPTSDGTSTRTSTFVSTSDCGGGSAIKRADSGTCSSLRNEGGRAVGR
jgi:hypothetical protein